MRPFRIVPPEILGNFFLPRTERARYALQALFLDGAVEAFEVPVVGGSPHTGMSVGNMVRSTLLREPLRELGTMITLERPYGKGRILGESSHKVPAHMGVGSQYGEGERESGEHIQPRYTGTGIPSSVRPRPCRFPREHPVSRAEAGEDTCATASTSNTS